MFSTLYLHIGQEKTGTTSIQHFLHRNQAALRDNGIFVPRSLGHENHKILAAYAFDKGSRDISVISHRAQHKSESVAAYRAEIETSLSRDIGGSTAQVGVISSEDLSRLYTPREVCRVVDLLRPFCKTLKIVAFTRRQDLMASSRYYSFVLGGSQAVQVLPATDQLATPSYYDYAHNIGLWADAVGEENVILVRFPEIPSASDFNSVGTFCDILGIDSAAYQMVQPQHVSLDAINQIILQNYNVLTQTSGPIDLDWLRAQLTIRNDRSLGYISSQAQAERFYSHFHADNQALFRRMKAEDQMFGLDFSMYPKENMRSRFQQQAIQRLLALLTRHEKATRP